MKVGELIEGTRWLPGAGHDGARPALSVLLPTFRCSGAWGVGEIELEVLADNTAAIALYAGLGFRGGAARGAMLRRLRIA